jgi:hypothetical protein
MTQPHRVGVEPVQEPDLIDRIARALPENLRGDYYRELSHCRTLPENDEMLRILRAMQFLVVLVDQAPGRIAVEREHIAEVLGSAMKSLETTHQANIAYQKKIEGRLANLPQEIANGINADAIAAQISESLRQQFHQTGLAALADGMKAQATGLRQASQQLSIALDQFSNPKTGAVPHVQQTLSSIKSDVKNAADHVRAQIEGLGKELWRSIAVLCLGALGIGFVLGILYYRWINPPTEATPRATGVTMPGTAQPSTPQTQQKSQKHTPSK